MPTPLEAEISALLRRQGDPALVAEELIQRWRKNLFDEDEQRDCAQFLIASGQYPILFQEISRMLKQGSKLPWGEFAEALGRAHNKPDELELQALFDGAEAQEALPDLLRSHQLDLFTTAFAEKRKTLGERRAEQINERKLALKDKLQFVRAQRMFEQEALVIEEIQALFPDEAEIKADVEAFRMRWAREIVANSTNNTDLTEDLQWKIDRLSPEQTTAKGLIVQCAMEMAEDNPRLAYDLAIGLHLMDFNAEALDVLNFATDTFATDWFRLELMLRARQFATALEESARLEAAYADVPEAAFAAVYARARSLYGLGQSAMAIDLLRSLVRIRPSYKSAQSLLMEWSGGDA